MGAFRKSKKLKSAQWWEKRTSCAADTTRDCARSIPTFFRRWVTWLLTRVRDSIWRLSSALRYSVLSPKWRPYLYYKIVLKNFDKRKAKYLYACIFSVARSPKFREMNFADRLLCHISFRETNNNTVPTSVILFSGFKGRSWKNLLNSHESSNPGPSLFVRIVIRIRILEYTCKKIKIILDFFSIVTSK